jgi:hypothetical protein
MFKRVVIWDATINGVAWICRENLAVYNTHIWYLCYTISFLSRNIDLEINFFFLSYLFKMFRRNTKKKWKEKERWSEKISISIVREIVFLSLLRSHSPKKVKFAF